jgi:hypothetical protein
MDTTISTMTISRDCHRKIVCENGMTPVISSSGRGKLDALA